MSFAYADPNREAYPNLREAAQEAWRGLTAFVQGAPYLVVNKEGSLYTLEGEDGTTLKLENFEWEPANEYNKLVAASRLPDSPLAEGRSFDGIGIGKLAYAEGQWEVLTDDGSAVVPIDEFIAHLASNNWLKLADDETHLWLLLNDGRLVHAPVSQVKSHPMLAYSAFNGDPSYADIYDDPYQAMGELRNGQVHLSSLIPPDYQNAPSRWEAIKTGRQVRNALRAEGIPASMTMTASAPGGDVSYPLYTNEMMRQVNEPQRVQSSMGTINLPRGGIGGHTNMYFAQNGYHAKLHLPPTSEYPEGTVIEVPGSIRDQNGWQFSHWNDNGNKPKPMDDVEAQVLEASHSPDEIAQALREAESLQGRRGSAEDYEAAWMAIVAAHEEGLRCPECGSHSMRAMHVENNSEAQMKCLTCGNEFKTDVTKNFTDHKGSFIAESEYHYIRKEGDEYCIWQKSSGKTLSCHASKEKAEEAFRAMMANKHGADRPVRPDEVDVPGDTRTLTYVIGGMQEMSTVHAENLVMALKELVERGATDIHIGGERDDVPGDTTLPETWSSWQKGSPYPSDSYKNAPDHTPKDQKKWPAEVNAVYNACMREGRGRGDSKDEKESSCAAIAWAQYEKSKKKDSARHLAEDIQHGQWDGTAPTNVVTQCMNCGRYREPDNTWGSTNPNPSMPVSHSVCPDCWSSVHGQDPSTYPHMGAKLSFQVGEEVMVNGQPGRISAQEGQTTWRVSFPARPGQVATYQIVEEQYLQPVGMDQPGATTFPADWATPTTASTGHTPGTRVEVTHPSNKGQRGSVLKHKGTDAATGEDTYDVLLDNGEKSEGLRHSDLKRIKSAKFNTDDHFLETVPILKEGYGAGEAFAPPTETGGYPSNPMGGQPANSYHNDSVTPECPNCHSNNTTMANQMGGSDYFRCLDCGTVFQGGQQQAQAAVKFAWNDVNGRPMQAGGWYVMHSPNYKVPDVFQVLNLEDNRIEGMIEGDEDYHFPLHISSDDVESNGYSFEPYTHEELERREHTATSPDPNQRAGEVLNRVRELMAQGASQDEVKAVMDQYYAILDQQQEQAEQAMQPQQPAPNQMPGQPLSHNKESRRSFTPVQQRELINENMGARARNFDKLNLEGTHYESQVKDDDDPFFLWL